MTYIYIYIYSLIIYIYIYIYRERERERKGEREGIKYGKIPNPPNRAKSRFWTLYGSMDGFGAWNVFVWTF